MIRMGTMLNGIELKYHELPLPTKLTDLLKGTNEAHETHNAKNSMPS